MLLDEKILNKFFLENFKENIFFIKKIGEGYISEVFKLNTSNGDKILKLVKSNNVVGYEYPYDIKKSLYISHLMYNNAYKINKIRSYGVYNIDNIFVQILDYVDASNISLDDCINDFDILDKIAKHIGNIHKYGLELDLNLNLNIDKIVYYKRGFREIFSNNETLLSIYENYYVGYDQEDLGWIILQKILYFYRKYINNINYDIANRRLTILHGDFWYDNVLVDKEKNVYFIDFSRILYGDPGIDIGRFVGELLVSYIVNQNNKYLEGLKYFLDKYINYSKDEEILKYLDMSILWVFFVDSSSLVQKYFNWNLNQFKNVGEFIEKYNGIISFIK